MTPTPTAADGAVRRPVGADLLDGDDIDDDDGCGGAAAFASKPPPPSLLRISDASEATGSEPHYRCRSLKPIFKKKREILSILPIILTIRH